MWERCEELLSASGSRTVRGAMVSNLYHDGKAISHLTATSPSGTSTEYEGSSFVSTMPLRELVFSLYPTPPATVLVAAEKLRYRDYLTVVLIVDREEVFPDNWIYVHDPGVLMGRIQNYKNWSVDMVPDPSTTSLGLEYFLWESDEHWSWDDDQLIAMGILECEKIGLIRSDEVLDATIVRMKKAYPVYDGSYRTSVDLIRDYLGSFSNLQTIGRNGLHRYNNQDHSMMTGVLAARNIMGETHDVWSVNTEKVYHEHRSTQDKTYGDRLVPQRIRTEVDSEIDAALLIEEEIEEPLFQEIDPVAFGVSIGLTSGTILFVATAFLLLKGGADPGSNLALLGQYFWGYSVSWIGAVIGFIEVAIGFCILGFSMAWLRNTGLTIYLSALKRREEAIQNQDLLDKL